MTTGPSDIPKLTGEILFAGDWHGHFTQASNAISHAIQTGIKTVIQLGDFGIWHDDRKFLDKLDHRLLAPNGIKLYFVDGNHEDFPRLHEYPLAPDGTRPVRSCISHLPRGLRLDWDGLNVLALGGAPSIDRKHRRTGYSWWPEELLTDEDIAKAIDGGPADIMLCHDSPSTAPNTVTDDPYLQHLAVRDFGGDMVDYCQAHRSRLAEVTDVVQPRILLHGHYHRHMAGTYRHTGSEKVNLVYGLDQGSARLAQTTRKFTTDEVNTTVRLLDNRN